MESKIPTSLKLRTRMGSLIIGNKVHPVYKGLNKVGRSKDATVIIRDQKISQHHAIITICDENRHFVSDFESINGTFVGNNKLQPLELHEMSDNSVIQFANVSAIYKKVLAGVQSFTDNCCNGLNAEMVQSQIYNDSFYTAATQVCQNTRHPAPNDFEDDYDFSDLPSQPVCETSKTKTVALTESSKRSLSIHEMPTQIFCADVTVGEKQIQTSADAAVIVSSTAVDIHDEPTQIMCYDVATSKCVSETNLSIHSMNTNKPSSSHSNTSKSLVNLSVDIIDETVLNNSGLDVTTQSSPNNNAGRSSVATTEDKVISSLDSEPQSQLHMSQLHKRSLKPIEDDTEDDSSGSDFAQTKSNKNKPLLESSENSDSNEICKKKKKCRKIDSDKSDSETDMEEIKETVSGNPTELVENSSAKEISEDSVNKSGVTLAKKKMINEKTADEKLVLRKESSESDTAVDDLEENVQKKPTVITSKAGLSNFEVKERQKQNHSTKDEKMSVDHSDSDTDMDDFEFSVKGNNENSTETAQALNDSKKLDNTDIILPTQVSENEDDEDDFNFMPKGNSTLHDTQQSEARVFDISQKLKELRTAIVPENHSEDSLRLQLSAGENNNHKSEGFTGDNDEDDKTPDISDVDEPDEVCVKVNQSDNIKNLVTNENDDHIFNEPTQKIVENRKDDTTSECINPDRKVSASGDNTQDIFTMDTQLLQTVEILQKDDTTPELGIDPNTNVDASGDKTQDIFEMDTQTLPVDDIFQKPLCKRVKKKSESGNIFTSATPQESSQSSSTAKDVKNRDDDIFLQPTQKIAVDNQNIEAQPNIEDRIFMQPTQKYMIADEIENFELRINTEEDIFQQPTQVITGEHQRDINILSKQPTIRNEDDIFQQPTQVITDEHQRDINILSKQPTIRNEDDIFVQPTQVILMQSEMVNKNKPDKDIFEEPTQRITVSDCASQSTKSDNTDIFMEATQVITLNDVLSDKPLPQPRKLSLSLHKSPEQHNKFDEVESQLEVMFATQTLKMNTQNNSRPSNPLLSVLDGKGNGNAEQNSEELQDSPEETSKIEDCILPESPNSLKSSSSLREYCERSTLPIDELVDLEVSVAEEKKRGSTKISLKELQNTPKKRGRPFKRKVVESEETAVVEKIRKRGRPLKNSSQEASTSSSMEREEKKTVKPTKSQVEENEGKRVDEEEVDDVQIERKDKNDEPCTSKQGEGDEKVNRNGNASEVDPDVDNKQNVSQDSNKKQTKTPLNKIRKSNRVTRKNIEQINIDVQNNEVDENKDSFNSKQRETRKNTRNQSGKIEDDGKQKVAEKPKRQAMINFSEPVMSTRKTRKNTKTNGEDIGENNEIEVDCENTTQKRETLTTSLQSSPSNISVGKRSKRLLTDESEKSKNETPAGRRTRGKKDSGISKNVEPSPSYTSDSVIASKTDKRLQNTNNRKGEPPVKKIKKSESSENEDVTSVLDNSAVTPNKSKQLRNLNVTTSTPDRNRRKQKPKVVFTMLNCPDLESCIRRLGGRVVDSVEACTVLVTGSVKRSQKLLAAVGQGKPVCSSDWLHESKKANDFLDPWDFIINDQEAEQKWNFSLRESLRRSSSKKLLEGFTVVLAVTEALEVLKAAVESCGGKWAMKMPAKSVATNCIVVANSDKKGSYSKFLKQKSPPIVVAPEAIFDGVLRQELHFEDHALS